MKIGRSRVSRGAFLTPSSRSLNAWSQICPRHFYQKKTYQNDAWHFSEQSKNLFLEKKWNLVSHGIRDSNTQFYIQLPNRDRNQMEIWERDSALSLFRGQIQTRPKSPGAIFIKNHQEIKELSGNVKCYIWKTLDETDVHFALIIILPLLENIFCIYFLLIF